MAAIIVTYNPDPNALERGLASIAPQVDLIVVVDNASHNLCSNRVKSLANALGAEMSFISLSNNIGVAAGFNIGAREAQSRGYSFITLFDQDSIPQENMIQKLELSYKMLCNKDPRVAAVGPRYMDPENGKLSSFARFGEFGIKQVVCGSPSGIVKADFLISSGSYISMRALSEVGDMEEALFIDQVDTEWCLRARSKGWSVYGVCDAIMSHSLGDSRRRFWFLRWRYFACHASFRYYYIFRNTLIMIRRDYVHLNCKMALFLHIAKLAVYMVIVDTERKENLRTIQRGILDGMRGKGGQMPKD